MLNGISGHADREGLLSWLDGFIKKPSMVFVNHGDDDSCSGFAEIVTQRFGIPASAPYSGSEYDLLKNEWIRITDPVYKDKNRKDDNAPARRKKDNAFSDLRDAVETLDRYTATLSGHSNYELKQLADRIRALISAPD